MLSQPPLVVLGLPRPFITTRGGGGELCSNPSFPQEGIPFGSFHIIGGIPPLYRLICPVRPHLFWRNHPPTTLIFNKDPPPSSSQHDRRRRQSRQHSFSSSPGRAVCWRRRRRRRKKEGGEEEEKKYTVCTQCLLLHDVQQYLSI